MNKHTSFERGAAASAALLITLALVWGFATMGYPAPAGATDQGGIAARGAAAQCRPG